MCSLQKYCFPSSILTHWSLHFQNQIVSEISTIANGTNHECDIKTDKAILA